MNNPACIGTIHIGVKTINSLLITGKNKKGCLFAGSLFNYHDVLLEDQSQPQETTPGTGCGKILAQNRIALEFRK